MKNKHYIFLFFIISLIFILHSVYLAVPAEDAFIGFRYVKNLADGYGLVWNIGDKPVEGYTNFLWILFCFAGMKAGIDIIVFSQVLGIISGFLVLVYSYLFCRKIFGLSKIISLLPPALLASAGPVAVWSSSGMETTLFTFFFLSAIYYGSLFLIHQNKTHLIISFFLLLSATLTRPEGFGIFLLFIFFYIITNSTKKKRNNIFGALLTGFAIYIIPFLVYFTWRLNYYGELLPLTFYAKTGGTYLQWIRGLKYFFFFSFHYLLPLLPALIIFTWQESDRIKKLFHFRKKPVLQASLLLIFLLTSYCIYIIVVGGDYMAMYRFFVPVLPIIYLLVAVLLQKLVGNSNFTKGKKQLIIVIVILAISGTFIHSTPLEKILFKKPGIIHGQYGGVQIEQRQTNRLSLIGKFFNEYKNNPNESLATDAIGAISFYSNMKIYGMHGLDDPVIAKMNVENMGSGFPGHEKSNFSRVLSKQPTYFMFSRELMKTQHDYPHYSEIVDSILQSDYKIVSVWLEDKKNSESGYFTFLERKK